MVQMTKIPLKRAREADNHFDTITTMANCLMLLSKNRASSEYNTTTTTNYSSNNRVFECKTCNRQFPSFQALGGHRASHKKPRLGGDLSLQTQLPAKPKTHECSICGLEFAIGQALGGHMRRHRVGVRIGNDNRSSISSGSASPPREPVVKEPKVVDQKRVWGLDLNLSPFENVLKFQLGKTAPPIGCFL